MNRHRFLLQTSQAVFEGGSMRRVIVEVQDEFAVLRLKGAAKIYVVPWSTLYRFAETQDAERELKAKKAQLGLW